MDRQQDRRVADDVASRTIETILRHDAKVTSYKLALIRAINDVVLSFPDAGTHNLPRIATRSHRYDTGPRMGT